MGKKTHLQTIRRRRKRRRERVKERIREKKAERPRPATNGDVDGTARLQTVARSDNEAYYALIEAFERTTGVPCLLNTSLNGGGEPLLETPEHALEFFRKHYPKVGALVVNGRLLRAPL